MLHTITIGIFTETPFVHPFVHVEFFLEALIILLDPKKKHIEWKGRTKIEFRSGQNKQYQYCCILGLFDPTINISC